LQDAPAQASRDWYTPGKAAPATINESQKLEQNWPREFPVKTGVPAVDNAGLGHGLEHIRVEKTDRQIVCDQTIPSMVPFTHGTQVRSETGPGYSGTYVYTKTDTQNNDGEQERKTGAERIYI